MTRSRIAGIGLLAAGIVLGTAVDRMPPRDLPRHGEFVVLTGDFHVHAFPGDGGVPAWELPREARRRGLDVIVVSNHNQMLSARLAVAAGTRQAPIVIAGQEVTTANFHVIAAGITDRIDWRLPARETIDAIHAQGGIAIAAHPTERSWRDGDEEALALLDGSEAAHPLADSSPDDGEEIVRFYRAAAQRNRSFAAIGSSDFHFGGRLGQCRTFLFVTEVSREGVLDAVRAARTVAWDGRDRLIGEPSLVKVVERLIVTRRDQPMAAGSRAAASWLALAGLLVLVALR